MKARVFLVYWHILFILCCVWGYFHLGGESRITPAIFFVCAGLCLGIMLKLLMDGNLTFASHAILIFATIGTSVGSYYTGGLRETNVCSFIMLMVTAIFLLGRWGLIWSIIGLFVAVGFQLAHWRGYVFPDSVSTADRPLDVFVTWFSSFVVILVFIMFYMRARHLDIQRLAEANRAKSRFIASISHEIRTPLHVIMGMNRLMERTELSDDQIEYLSTTRQNSEILLALIDDLLDMSSLQYGKFVLKNREFSPASLVAEVSQVLSFASEEKGLRFEQHLGDDVPEKVVGDRRRLAQVLLNIGGNAVKYTDEGTVRLHVGSSDGDLGLHFEIEDTGPGISTENRERIFGSFTQGTPRQEGAGLGLYISSEIVERMGGRIDLETDPGKGSTFTIDV